MLKAIIGIVDTSGDGKIQYEGAFSNGRERAGSKGGEFELSQHVQNSEFSSKPPSGSYSCCSAPSIATRTAG
jgi:hypothetical protein